MKEKSTEGTTRRDFVSAILTAAMTAGLIASIGGLGAAIIRFAYPAVHREPRWLIVAAIDKILPALPLAWQTPVGTAIIIVRRNGGGDALSFVALSSICPHLGCSVHWEPQEQSFVCPCHHGAFDASGVARAGPPAKSGLSLARFPLRVNNGLLYIGLPPEQLL